MHKEDTFERIQVRCCVVGGGPAGMLLGLLLARSGVDVVVLEKHGDFLRDFRGDTIHPSTLELLAELDLLDTFLQRPHQEMKRVNITLGAESFTVADFAHLPTRCKFIAFMPQWDFLDFVAEQAKRYPTFDLRMNADVTDLIREGERVVGVHVQTDKGTLEVRADLVVGADGRHSTVRQQAGLNVRTLSVPIDVLWTRIPKNLDLREASLAYISSNKFMVLIDRQDYFQCGFLIPKGTFEAFKQRGLAAFQADIVKLAPFVKEQVAKIATWDDVKLLTVAIDRLERWHLPGLLCIGDAAHAMSPAGGVGINLAIQDAVATANQLAEPLRRRNVAAADLQAVQNRRLLPTRIIQAFQATVHNGLLAPDRSTSAPTMLAVARIVLGIPWTHKLAARIVGLGPRPEHIHTPALPPAS